MSSRQILPNPKTDWRDRSAMVVFSVACGAVVILVLCGVGWILENVVEHHPRLLFFVVLCGVAGLFYANLGHCSMERY